MLASGKWGDKRTAIVVVDVQNDFVEGGSLGVAGGKDVAGKVMAIANDAAEFLFYTKDWHIDPGPHFADEPDYIDSWPRHCVAETEGASFALPFPAFPNRIFYKGQYAAAYSGAEAQNDTGWYLGEALADGGFEAVEVVGIALDYCVLATAIDLAQEGFEVSVDTNWTASVHPENDEQTISTLRRMGVTVNGS